MTRAPVLGTRGRAPSHLNRVIDAVRRSSVPAPVIYGLVWVTFVAIELAAKAADGTISDLRLIHVVLPTFAIAAFPAVHFFTDEAARALKTARPLLRLSDEETDAFRLELTVLRAGPASVAAAPRPRELRAPDADPAGGHVRGPRYHDLAACLRGRADVPGAAVVRRRARR